MNTTLSPKQLRIRINLGAPASRQILSRPDRVIHSAAVMHYASDSAHKKPRKKLQSFEFHNVRIPYGKYTSGKVTYWMLFYWHGDKRMRESRVSFDKAKKRAEEIALSIKNGQIAMSQFTEDQRAHYKFLCELAAKAGAPPETLISEASAARTAALSRAKIVNKTCQQIVDELLEAKQAEGAGQRWIDDLESRLNRFAENFKMPLSDIADEDIRLWLTRLNLSKRSWNNNRTALLALTTFARERKYVALEWQGLSTIKPFRLVKPVEEIYSPEQIRTLLFTAEKHYPQHLSALAIMAFAGCRHCELRDQENSLDWKDVHFKTEKIHISEALAKSNTGRRYIPMSTNLVAWIEPYAKPRGPVCPVANLTGAFARLADKAGIKWKDNGLRNSFISYRCAATQNIPQVAGEAGNSVSEIHKSYRRELTQDEGNAWFGVMPTRADVLPLFAHAKLS